MCSNVTHLHYEENCLTEQTLIEACEALLTNFPKPRRYPLLPRCTIRWRKCKPWWERSPEFESKSKFCCFRFLNAISILLFKDQKRVITGNVICSFSKGHSRPLFPLFSSIQQLTVNMFILNFSDDLDSNWGPLV